MIIIIISLEDVEMVRKRQLVSAVALTHNIAMST